MATQKPKDWHSRRHKSSDAHMEAQRKWREKKIRKKAAAEERIAAAKERHPKEQLRRLDKRGLRAEKERRKLTEKLLESPHGLLLTKGK